MHGVPLLKFALMLIRKVSEIGVLICLKNIKKMRREEGESGFNEEDTELDNLLQNITEERDEASASRDDQLQQKLKMFEAEKSNAEDVAMETFAEIRKRKLKDGNSVTKQTYGSETMIYLKNRTEQGSYFKQ